MIVKATPKIQEFCVIGNNVTFQLSVNSDSTEGLSTMSSASEIEDALNRLPGIMAVGRVDVFLQMQAERWCFSVIFLSQSEVLPAVSIVTDAEYESSVIEKNFLRDFQLGFESRNTEPLSPGIEPSDLRSNITELFATECTRTITERVFFSDTYEYDVRRFNSPLVDNSVEALCGRYSVRNPRHVYYTGQSVDELTGKTQNQVLTIGSNPNRNEYRYVSEPCTHSEPLMFFLKYAKQNKELVQLSCI